MAICLTLANQRILIINTYLNPLSAKNRSKNIWTKLREYLDDLACENATDNIVLGGDFNARIGPYDPQPEPGSDEPYRDERVGSQPSRLSKDTKSNFAGTQLVALSKCLNLRILNGSIRGDIPGEFTFMSGNRCSTIDYFLASPNLLSEAKWLQVLFEPGSDHFPLLLMLSLPLQPMRLRKSGITNLEPTMQANCRAKWSPLLSSKIKALLEGENMTLWRQDIINNNTSPDPLISYGCIIRDLKPLLIRDNRGLASSSPRPSQRWFDAECQAAKQTLLTAYRAFRATSTLDTPLFRRHLANLKNAYKKLLTKKKKADQRATWNQLIQAAKDKNSSIFWKLTSGNFNTHSAPLDSCIPSNTWECYFQSLYSDSYQQVSPTLDPDLPAWAPVSVGELKSLIGQLKSNKAPGPDFIPPELLKQNVEFWAPLLASLFSKIDSTGQIPNGWREAIVVPFFKKGRRDNPACYRPVSLLNVIGKLYAGHLLDRLKSWAEQSNLIADEQAGFREGRSTMDHVLIMQHLIEKFGSKASGSLFAVFIDLKSAFDSISRSKLWAKLEAAKIDRRLLYLIRTLYSETSLKVRCTTKGHLSNSIPTAKGVKQGCVLAPTLFNIYINGLVELLNNPDLHAPTLANRKIPVLLYADDTVILSRTPLGLKRALVKFTQFCSANELEINYQKTKVLVFGRRPKKRIWRINGHKLEQVKAYKYLGVILSQSGSRLPHHEHAAAAGLQTAQAIAKFTRARGGHYVPAAIKLFLAKTLPQLLYGSFLGPSSSTFSPLERVQSRFLRSIFQVASYASNASLRLEAGLISVEARVTLSSINIWLKLFQPNRGLIHLIPQDNFQSSWIKMVHANLRLLGLSPEVTLAMGPTQAKVTLRQRIYDSERQKDVHRCPSFIATDDNKYRTSPAAYLSTLEPPQHRRAFFLARWGILPSAVLEGRFKKTPHSERLCPCEVGEIESTEHVLFRCSFYMGLRDNFISPLLQNSHGLGDRELSMMLLNGADPQITKKCASFLAAACKTRKTLVCQEQRLKFIRRKSR